MPLTDQLVEARVKVSWGTGTGSVHYAGVMARRAGEPPDVRYYAALINPLGELEIRRAAAPLSGPGCLPINVGAQPDAWYLIRLEATGPTGNVRIRTFLDGALIHDCMQTSNTIAEGDSGLIAGGAGAGNQAHFDDFRVRLP